MLIYHVILIKQYLQIAKCNLLAVGHIKLGLTTQFMKQAKSLYYQLPVFFITFPSL